MSDDSSEPERALPKRARPASRAQHKPGSTSRKPARTAPQLSAINDDDGIPICVEVALRLADALEDAAFAPFPDLDIPMDFSTKTAPRGGLRKVRSRIEAAAAWADRIADVCGTDDAPVRPEPLWERIAGWTLYNLFRQRGDAAKTWYARDVLGDPPSALRRHCASDALRAMRPGQANDPLTTETDDTLLNDRIALLRWRNEFRSLVAEGHRTIRAHALLLVTWIRDAADRVVSATLPEIELPADHQASRSIDVVVILAGRRRPRRVTATHGDILRDLAKTGKATAYRKDVRGARPHTLETRVPELRGLIETVPRSSDTDNRATYSVNAAVQARIRLLSIPDARGK